MKATSQKALIMSEEEMRAYEEFWTAYPESEIYILPDRLYNPLAALYNRVTDELKRESGSTL